MTSVTYDALGSFTQPAGAVPSLTGSITAAVGADVVVAVSYLPGYGGTPPSSVTCGGTAMTALSPSSLSGDTGTATNECDTTFYRLAGCGTGSALSIVVTNSSSGWICAQAVSLLNVGSAGTPVATNPFSSGASSTNLDQSVTLTAGQLSLQAFGSRGFGSQGSWTGGTKVWNGTNGAGEGLSLSYATASATFGGTMSAADYWSGLNVIFSPTAGGSNTVTPGSATVTAAGGTPALPGPVNVSPTGTTVAATSGRPQVLESPLNGLLIKLDNGQSVTILLSGDSTGWGYEDADFSTEFGFGGRFAIALGVKYNANVQVYALNYPTAGTYNPAVQVYTSTLGASAPMITVYDGAWPGATFAGNLIPDESSIFTPTNPDVVIINHGFNEPSTSAFTSGYLTFINDVQTKYPGVPIIATTENATTLTIEQNHSVTFAALFAAMITTFLPGESLPLSPPLQYSTAVPGVWVLDTQQAGQTAADLYTDGLHPNSTGYGMQASFMLQQLAPGVPYPITPIGGAAAAAGGVPGVNIAANTTIQPGGATVTGAPGTPAVTAPDTVTPAGTTVTAVPGTPQVQQAAPAPVTVSPTGATGTATPGTPGVETATPTPQSTVAITGLISAPFAQTVKRKRPVYDNFGNLVDWLELLVPAVVDLDPAARRPGTAEGKEDRFFQDATLFVPRGSDIKSSDFIHYNGWKFVVAGRPRGDQVNPFTGDNLGWMSFRMQGAG